MDKKQLNTLLSKPELINTETLLQLHAIAEKHPYFTALHVLKAKGSHQLNDAAYKKNLHTAAIYVADRIVLKEYLLQDDTTGLQRTDATSKSGMQKSKLQAPHEKEPVTKAIKKEYTPAKVKTTDSSDDDKKPISPPIITYQPTSASGLSDDFFKELEANLNSLNKKKSELDDIISAYDSAKPSAAPKKRGRPKKTEAKQKTSETEPKKTNTKTAAKEKELKKKKVGRPKKEKPAETKATRKVGRPKKDSSVAADSQPKKKVGRPKKNKAAEQAPNKPTIAKKGKTEKKTEYKDDIVADLAKREEKKISDKKRKEQLAVIERFIESEPRIIQKNKAENTAEKKPQVDLSEGSTSLNEDLISENLALIFIKQGKKNKAIDIYKKLIWKFPQKKSYFATQIEKLKEE